ncbi:MAG TPA: DNA primase small subunit domain-containing protein [archaeon]|nr:DNA primase small subunit domain-containing protein [archaeon]
MGEEGFLRQHLRSYYSKNEINSVPEISAREFGIGDFGKKISNRHLDFKNNLELNSFLREKTPFYISYSNARYEFPGARPMEKKNLLGADLIYEFDADDIQTDCKLNHDSWKCSFCGAHGKGAPEKCSECGFGVKVEEWVCQECLGETRKQTQKLLNLLEKDFGFNDGISVNFSGSKGFHTHIRSSSIQKLSKSARLELLDYITCTNLSLESLGFASKAKNVFLCPKRTLVRGWAKKLMNSLVSLLEGEDAAKIAVMGGITVSSAKKFLKEKQRIISSMDRGLLINVPGIKPEKFYPGILNYIVQEEKLEVDRQTSIDINKIIRVPDSLHGSTGLVAKPVSLDELSSFDALKETVVFGSDPIKLKNISAPKFYLNNETFGPFENENALLPLFAGIYLIARGSALLESES